MKFKAPAYAGFAGGALNKKHPDVLAFQQNALMRLFGPSGPPSPDL